jgi:hypothetical protein
MTARDPRAGRPDRIGPYWRDELARLRDLEARLNRMAGDLRHGARTIRDTVTGFADDTARDALDTRAAEREDLAGEIEGMIAASDPPFGMGTDHLAEIAYHVGELIRQRTESTARLAELAMAIEVHAPKTARPLPVVVTGLDRDLEALADLNRHLPEGSVLRGYDTGREMVLRGEVWLDFGGPAPLDEAWRGTHTGRLLAQARASDGGAA